jgi:cytochrome oxidase assembly protein ShyY1
VTLWSARALNPDSLRARVPYALATFFVVELPGPRVPGKPLRGTPRPLDEFMHVSYAIQWFLFGAILLGGSLALVVSGRRSRREGVGAPLEDR